MSWPMSTQYAAVKGTEGEAGLGKAVGLRASRGLQLVAKAWQVWAAKQALAAPARWDRMADRRKDNLTPRALICRWMGLVGFVTHAEKKKACLTGTPRTSLQSQAPT